MTKKTEVKFWNGYYECGCQETKGKYEHQLSALRKENEHLEQEIRRIKADLVWKAYLLNVRRVPVQEYKSATFLLISKNEFEAVVGKRKG